MKQLNKRQKNFIEQAHERFVHERICGYMDKAGVSHAPISKLGAENLWKRHKARFDECVFDPDIIENFQLDLDEPIPQKWRKYVGPPLKKISRPTKPAKTPTTLAEGRRHRPTKRKSNESKISK